MNRQPQKRLPTYQASDIARLLNGEIDDPRLAKNMLAAEELDPQVQHFFDMLDLEAVLGWPEEEQGSDPAITDAIRQRLAGLSRSRLFSLQLDVEPGRLLAGESVQARVFANGDELDCRLAPGQEKGEYFLEMPKALAGMRLLNITVACLRLHEKCIPWSAANVAIDWSAAKLGAYHATKVDLPERRSLQSIEPLRAFAMHCATAKDAGPRLIGRPVSGGRLDIRCNARDGREQELAIVEITHPSTTTTQGRVKFFYPVCLDRDRANPASGELMADFDIPLPADVELGDVGIIVRSPEEEELWRFGSEHVSMLLGEAFSHVALPLTEEAEGRYRFGIEETEHNQLLNKGATWFIRATPRQDAAQKKGETPSRKRASVLMRITTSCGPSPSHLSTVMNLMRWIWWETLCMTP